MSVVAFVGNAGEAESVVTWAGRFAAARQTELIIFYAPETLAETGLLLLEGALALNQDELAADPAREAILKALKRIIRTRKARTGRISQHAVQIRRIASLDPISNTVAQLRLESPDLFVTACFEAQKQSNGKTVGYKIAAKSSCDTIVLYRAGPCATVNSQIVIGTTEGAHDKGAIVWAAETASALHGRLTVVREEAKVGDAAIEIGKRDLRAMLRELELKESSRLIVKAVAGESTAAALAEVAHECDLLLVGANFEKKIPKLLALVSQPTVATFRKAPQLIFSRANHKQSARILPQLNPTDYADLYEMLQAGSRWNRDFIFMLCLAAAIATLGLLQSSPAVVIGSMLLAPLMTPMIGMGLALNQGNERLAYTCFRSIGRGFLAALGISIAIGFLTPGSDLTPEILARTEPNILDLLIALFSGMAAAYALARPSVAGSIAGVAIATALVPPLCSVGISLGYGHFYLAVGAFALLLANVMAIILAAAATFRLMGLRTFTDAAPRRFWVRHVIVGLMFSVLAISIPLASTFMRQILEGKNTPIALAVTSEMRDILHAHINKKPGVEILFAGRTGIDHESDPVDFAIILSSFQALPRSEGEEIIRVVQDAMQNPDLRIKVACVVTGWTADSNQGGIVSSTDPTPKQTPHTQTPPEQTPPEQTPPEQTPPEQTPPEQTPPEQTKPSQ